MKKILFKGAGSAVPTPFNENGVNLEEFKRFLQFQIDNDIDALIVCGTTGESSTMTKDEKKLLLLNVLSKLQIKIKLQHEKFLLLQELAQIIPKKQLKCLKLLSH